MADTLVGSRHGPSNGHHDAQATSSHYGVLVAETKDPSSTAATPGDALSTSRDIDAGPNHRRPIEPADICRFRSVGAVVLHPSAEDLVFAVTWPDTATDSNRSVLYSSTVDGADRRQLTHGHQDFGPRFSPDGTRMAFCRSAPNEPTKVMVLSWPVGEVTEVGEFADGAFRIEWLGRDRLLVLAARRPEGQIGLDDEELARRPRIITRNNYRYNGRGWTHDRPRQLVALSVADTGAAEKVDVGLPRVDHEAFAISPDGTQVVAVVDTDDDADLTGANHLWLYHVDGADVPTRLTEPGGSWASVLWHPDGTVVATGQRDNAEVGFHRPHLISLPPAGSAMTALADQDLNVIPPMSFGRGAVPVPGAVLYPGVRRGRMTIDRFSLDPDSAPGTARTVVHEGDHQVVGFDASADGLSLIHI